MARGFQNSLAEAVSPGWQLAPATIACPDCAKGFLRLTFGVPGDLDTPTGGYRYDRRIIGELRQLGWQVDVVDIGDSFPFPSVAQRADALALLSAVPAGRPTVLDGLAFGALPRRARSGLARRLLHWCTSPSLWTQV